MELFLELESGGSLMTYRLRRLAQSSGAQRVSMPAGEAGERALKWIDTKT